MQITAEKIIAVKQEHQAALSAWNQTSASYRGKCIECFRAVRPEDLFCSNHGWADVGPKHPLTQPYKRWRKAVEASRELEAAAEPLAEHNRRAQEAQAARAREEGYQAFKRSERRLNPYLNVPGDEHMHVAWARGWVAAESEARLGRK